MSWLDILVFLFGLILPTVIFYAGRYMGRKQAYDKAESEIAYLKYKLRLEETK